MKTFGVIGIFALLQLCRGRELDSKTIGKCLFFGDQRAECSGRLHCKPTAPEPAGAETTTGEIEIDQICPGRDEIVLNGTWRENQGVVPAQYTAVPSSQIEVATCFFRTDGTFKCDAGPTWLGEFWEGQYRGSLNSAFDLGLDSWYFEQRTTTTTTTITTTTTEPTTLGWKYVESYESRERQRQAGGNSEAGNDDDSQTGSRQNSISDSKNRSDNSDDDLQRVTGTRREQSSFDGDRLSPDDEELTSITYTVNPRRVFVCEFYNNGQVGCRNCTERIRRIASETGEKVNRRDYNCTQPRTGPILKRWTAENGIIPTNPIPDASPRAVIATCIFEKSSQTYECHGESAMCPDEQGNRVHSNKCLSGRRWNGDYNGDFGYL